MLHVEYVFKSVRIYEESDYIWDRSMEKNVTIYDVAKKVGLSTATINRALNNSPLVREDTREKVAEAARELGYKPSRTASSLSRSLLNIVCIVFKDENTIEQYWEDLIAGYQYALQELFDFNVRGEVITYPVDFMPEDFRKTISGLQAKDFNAMIITPHPDERLMEIMHEELSKINIKTVAYVSADVIGQKRLFTVRNNSYYAGKMAAQMLYHLVEKGKPVALLTKSHEGLIHDEAIHGFRKVAKQYGMDDVGVYEHRDDPNIAYYLATKLINDYPNLGGVYLATANSITFCKRLCEMGKDQEIKVVASDVFPAMVEMVKKDIVNATIFQHPFEQARLAVQYMFEHLAEGKKIINDEELLDPIILIKSNIDLYKDYHSKKRIF